jgi:uncharacterized protein (TIGR01244 family)
MTDIRPVTDDFAVAPQILPDELPEIARRGFRLLINNRPDGESSGQPPSADIAAAARGAGLDYVHIPIRGAPGAGEVEAVAEAVRTARGPVLSFCRSGTRSIVAWAMAEAAAGRPREGLVRLGHLAGYDLSGVV